jgi:hypothetical protein
MRARCDCSFPRATPIASYRAAFRHVSRPKDPRLPTARLDAWFARSFASVAPNGGCARPRLKAKAPADDVADERRDDESRDGVRRDDERRDEQVRPRHARASL